MYSIGYEKNKNCMLIGNMWMYFSGTCPLKKLNLKNRYQRPKFGEGHFLSSFISTFFFGGGRVFLNWGTFSQSAQNSPFYTSIITYFKRNNFMLRKELFKSKNNSKYRNKHFFKWPVQKYIRYCQLKKHCTRMYVHKQRTANRRLPLTTFAFCLYKILPFKGLSKEI